MTCIAGATVPDLRHPGAVPDAATVFLHQTGRLQECALGAGALSCRFNAVYLR